MFQFGSLCSPFLNFASDLEDRAICTLWYAQLQEVVLPFRKDSPFHSKCASSPILNDLCTLYSIALTSFRRKNAAELRQNSSEVLILFVGLTFSARAGTLASHCQDKFQLRVAVQGHKFSTVSAAYKYSFLLNDIVHCQIPPQFLLHFQVCERTCMSF